MMYNVTRFSITPMKDFWGIKFWRQILPEGFVPRFHVYEYIGVDNKHDLHFFKLRGTSTIIWRRLEHLNEGGFGPLLLDIKKINERLKNKGCDEI